MICLTGDVHQQSLRNAEHRAGYSNELLYARQYLSITEQHKIKTTLYVTGQEILDHQEQWKSIAKQCLLGGHTFDAFQKLTMSRLLGKYFYKRWYYTWHYNDIIKTIDAFKTIGVTITDWRTHAYASDKDYRLVLGAIGIKTLCDNVQPENPRWVRLRAHRMLDLPITVTPDHENLSHGTLTGQKAEDWATTVMDQVASQQEAGKDSVLLIHPTCMKVLDNFGTFRRICEFLSQYESATINELSRRKKRWDKE